MVGLHPRRWAPAAAAAAAPPSRRRGRATSSSSSSDGQPVVHTARRRRGTAYGSHQPQGGGGATVEAALQRLRHAIMHGTACGVCGHEWHILRQCGAMVNLCFRCASDQHMTSVCTKARMKYGEGTCFHCAFPQSMGRCVGGSCEMPRQHQSRSKNMVEAVLELAARHWTEIRQHSSVAVPVDVPAPWREWLWRAYASTHGVRLYNAHVVLAAWAQWKLIQ